MPCWINQAISPTEERRSVRIVIRSTTSPAIGKWPANAGTAKPRSTTEAGSGTEETVALIDDTPPFVVGASRLRRPGTLRSAETIAKTYPSRSCDSGELNSIKALLVLAEIVPLIVAENVMVWAVSVFVTVRVNVSLTVVGDVGDAIEAVVNVPRLTLLVGGAVADDTNEV